MLEYKPLGDAKPPGQPSDEDLQRARQQPRQFSRSTVGGPDQRLVLEELVIKTPGVPGSITLSANRAATGIWLQTGKGNECIGLVVQPGLPPYIIFHDEKGTFPAPLAISADVVQLPDPAKGPKGPKGVTFIPITDLLAALRHIQNEHQHLDTPTTLPPPQ